MILLTIFNHNAPLLMGCMVVVMLIAVGGVSPQFTSNNERGFGLVPISLLTLFTSIFAIQSGDFVYTTFILQTGHNMGHLEQFYQDLWNFQKDILFWRFVVFGGSLLLLLSIIKLLNVNIKFACFIFVITQMFYFGQLRNMLGFMMMFFSIVILFRFGTQKHYFIGVVVSLIGLWSSMFLHKSMWMYLLFLIPATIPFGKRMFKISIFAFPILYVCVFVLSNLFITTFVSADMQEHIIKYYVDAERETTIMQTLRTVVMQLSYLYLLYLILKDYCQAREEFPPVMMFLTRYAYLLMYLGFLFYGQRTGGWLYERFVGAGEIALMFVMMWYFYLYPRTQGVRLAFGVLIFCILYQMLYVCTVAGPMFVNRFNKVNF